MMGVFAIEPDAVWQAGDRAYCIWAARYNGKWLVDAGKIYEVEAVEHISGLQPCGLKIKGVQAGDRWGFYSNRFVKVSDGRPMAMLQRRTARTWMDAYDTSNRNRKNWPAPNPAASTEPAPARRQPDRNEWRM
jgi:hypothetical protein